MKPLIDYNIIFWDFDGVIINSEKIRKEGFKNALDEYNLSDVNSLLKFHKKNGGLSRYVKFNYFFEEILDQPIEQKKVEKLIFNYSQYCVENLKNKKLLIDEVIEYIIKKDNCRINHIASGSDSRELNELCDFFEISDYFKSIDGSPEPKKEILKRVINQNNYSKKDICLIGDSINDFEAALDNEIQFFGYNNLKLKSIKKSNYIDNF